MKYRQPSQLERERQQAILDTFTPWYEQPVRIARLLRWLVLMDETPESIPDFIESAESWTKQYDEMVLWEHTV